MGIGHALRSARIAAGLSQVEAAREACVTQAAISRWELGHVSPTWDTLVLLARVYRQSLMEIVAEAIIVEARKTA